MIHVEQSRAKLNLLLAVEPKIVQGKHPLTSVFVTISLHDTLTFDFKEGRQSGMDDSCCNLDDPQSGDCAHNKTEGLCNGISRQDFPLRLTNVTLEVTTAPDIEALDLAAKDNIVMRATEAFFAKFNPVIPAQRLDIHLEKRIPSQAGLGGGSSNAAATLRALARITGIEPTAPELLDVARTLGADVPFFLFGGCVHMRGFGDEFVQRLPLPQLDLVLVKPIGGVSTKEAYRVFDEMDALDNPDTPNDSETMPASQALLSQPRTPSCICVNHRSIAPQALLLQPRIPSATPLIVALQENAFVRSITKAMANNLEPAASYLLKEIANMKQLLSSKPGVIHAMLTGSGSTIFGVCEDAASAQQAANDFRSQGYWACAATTIAG